MEQEWNTTIHDKIRVRREELGLSPAHVAMRCALSVFNYADMEGHEDEIYLATAVHQLKCVCALLGLDLLELLDTECAFCGPEARPYDQAFDRWPMNRLIKTARERLGLSPGEFANRLEVTDEWVRELEEDPDLLNGVRMWVFQPLSELLDIPPQILLRWPCPKCGR